MKELVPQSNIHDYAIRNTSSKMPIEQKYLEAFVSSIFSSPELKELYERLQNIMWNEDSPMIFLSYWKDIGIINEEPYRSIVAYAMLKKDEKLFEMISSALFTGTFELQWDQNFVKKIPHYSDENMAEEGQTEEPPYTDADLYTDMVEGIPFLVFHNIYCDKYNNYTPSSRYQTSEELKANIEKFNMLITICKPARAEVIVLYEPYVFVHMTIPENNAGTEFVLFNDSTPPISSAAYISYINNLTNEQILSYYNTVNAHDDLRLNQVSSYPDIITPKTAVKFNDKLFVGDNNGGIRSSADGKQFEFITSLPTSINDFAVFNNQLYVSRLIYNSGDKQPRLYTSVDGKSFTNPYLPLPTDTDKETNILFEYNNIIYAGTNSGLYQCDDLFNFSLNKSIPEDYKIYSFAIFNDIIYVGTSNGIYTSTDGNKFIQKTSFPTDCIVRALIVKDNKLYVGTTGSYVYISSDGNEFIQNTTSGSRINTFVIFNNNLYAGSPSNGIFVLYNNEPNERFIHLDVRNPILYNCMVVYNNELYVAISSSSGYEYLMKSTDGTNFSISYTSYRIYAIGVYGNQLYLSQHEQGGIRGIYRTTNGRDFTRVSITIGNSSLSQAMYGTSFLDYNNCLYTSMNSISAKNYNSSFFYLDTTFKEKSPLPALLTGGNKEIQSMIEYHNKLFIAVKDTTTLGLNYQGTYRTSDNLNFTSINNARGDYTRFFIINNRLFIYSNNNGLQYSDDGETFFNSNYPTESSSNHILSMCEFNDKIYLAVKGLDICVSSDNGQTFTQTRMFNRTDTPEFIFTSKNILFFIKNITSSSYRMSIYQSYDGETIFEQKPILPYQAKSMFRYNDILFCGMLNNGLFTCENYEKPQEQYVITNKSISNGVMTGRYLKIEIMTTEKPFVWGNLKLLSGDNSQPVHLPDITIKPTTIIEQKTSSKYFITVELFFQN